MCRLQIVSITVGNMVIHRGHCVSSITCFLLTFWYSSLFHWASVSLFLPGL